MVRSHLLIAPYAHPSHKGRGPAQPNPFFTVSNELLSLQRELVRSVSGREPNLRLVADGLVLPVCPVWVPGHGLPTAPLRIPCCETPQPTPQRYIGKRPAELTITFCPQPVQSPYEIDLLNPLASVEASKHKLKRLVQTPNSYFMDVKCPGCFTMCVAQPAAFHC
jgi:hypothetical protein